MRTDRAWIWLRLVWQHRFDVSLSRWPTVFAICIFSLFNLVMWLIDEAIYGWRARRCRITESPVFILGHWRAGTTLLHELLIYRWSASHQGQDVFIFPFQTAMKTFLLV